MMKIWMKIALGLVLTALLAYIGYRLIVSMLDIAGQFVDAGVSVSEPDPQYQSPEPETTMPAYIGEDGFYDPPSGN